MATQSTSVPATEDQMKRMRRLVEDAAEKAVKQLGLDKDAVRRLVEFGVVGLVPHFITLFSSLVLTDEFADEEVLSTYGYLSGYKPKSVAEQMVVLKAIFPKLKSFDESAVAKELLAGAEGNFLIPRWQELAPTYGEAVELVLAALKQSRNGRFVNYCENQLGPDRLRESAKKSDMFQKLGNEQPGHNVLVVQAQFGLRHRGKSVRRARVVMGGNECGLGAFEIGIMLLTHPDRLANYDDLYVDCSGDEYAPRADGSFCYAPYFYIDGSYLKFRADYVGRPVRGCGSASAFMVVAPSK